MEICAIVFPIMSLSVLLGSSSSSLASLQVFRLKEFRPLQLDAINAAAQGHDCLLLMPTGEGKSLCFQLPALLEQKVTIVISPLRALIFDQLEKLQGLGVGAACLVKGMSYHEENSIYNQLRSASKPGIKLLYVTPEKVGGWHCVQ